MQLNLGNNIRQYRRKDKRTQEQLAEVLGVTAQAVSRWESGGSYPDMDLIPSIANFFGVSIDELFGYEGDRNQRIDALVAQIFDMIEQNNGKDVCVADCIAFARSALLEFPGNEKLMVALASALFNAGYVRYGEKHLVDDEGYGIYDVNTHKTYTEWVEAVSIYEKVLQTLPMGSLRDHATKELSQLYLNLGEDKKCMELVESAPDMWNCREFLQAQASTGKKQVIAHSATLLQMVRASAMFIVNITASADKHLTPDEKVENIASAIRLFEDVCPDGNFGTQTQFVGVLEMLRSYYLWTANRKDEVFDALEKARNHNLKFVQLCEDGRAKFTAPLVKLLETEIDCPVEVAREDYLSMADDWPWFCLPDVESVKAEISKDPRWKAWLESIKL